MKLESLKSPNFGALPKSQMIYILGGGHPVSTDGGNVNLGGQSYAFTSDSFEYNDRGVLEFRSYLIDGKWVDA